ncbi:MAG: hypothetical protein KFB96_06370 [Thiocapsa sp.]|uniref:hypothetical protein n=1 Tax=Thiocapsa sp. TaxID=2024551 RepID=UPI001BD00459|nr:hypothetical protein [Thiocapsa sp.]QVL50087.1 MAG: hypothetical protein KFB96_06370 [Thiocapsa sp.]
MYALIWGATAGVIVAGALYAFYCTRDAFHPAIIVAAPLAFVYGIWPFLLNQDGGLESLFGSQRLTDVGTLYLLSMGFLYLGILRFPRKRVLMEIRRRSGFGSKVFTLGMSGVFRQRILFLSVALGLVSVIAYAYAIDNVGGLTAAYGRAKGGGHAGSGYVGEAVLLSFPAILLLAIARQGARRVQPVDILLALLMAMPHLLQGTLGGRRGPLFLVLAVLFLAWFIARGRPPSLKLAGTGLVVIGLMVLLVHSQRQHLYIGAEGEFDASRMMNTLTPEALEGNDYVAGVASVIVSDYYGDFTWGREHLITLLIRPIPRQIWPSKYEDAGAFFGYLMVEGGGSWVSYSEVLGFSPPRGSATGFVANLYGSFAWGVLLVMFLFGWGLAALWNRHRLRGGLWTLLFAEAMILSIYLPTQSFSAFYHRFLIMAVVTTILWRIWVDRGGRASRPPGSRGRYRPLPPWQG